MIKEKKDLFKKVGLLIVTSVFFPVMIIAGNLGNNQIPLPIPIVHVPYMKNAPQMDGVINPTEWQGAARITGFMGYQTKTLMPEKFQPVWWVGWDDKNLYFAQKYVLYPKGTIIASEKEGDKGGSNPTASNRILCDDHVEIQLATIEDRKAVLKDHFYKFIINAYGAVADQRRCHSVGWEGFEWESNAKIGSKVSDSFWTLEIAIPFNSLGYKGTPKDLTKIYTQLVSSADPELFYVAWVPYAWLSWQYFPELILDRNTPAVQVNLGAPESGQLDVAIDLANNSQKTSDVSVQVKVTDASGKAVFDKTEKVNLSSGANKKLEFKSDSLGLKPPKGNTWETVFLRKTPVNMMQVVVKDTQGKILYRNDYRFTLTPNNITENLLKPFAMRRQVTGEPIVYSAYMPYYNKLEVFADTAILGMDPDYKQATQVKVSLEKMFWKHRQGNAKQAGMVFATKTVPIDKSGVTTFTIEVPELTEGQYVVIIQLLNDKNKILFASKEPFRRYKFPWEHNKIATATESIPPFEPIKLKGNKLTLWNRVYSFGNSGLPTSIISAEKEVLKGEPELTAVIDGNQYTLKPAGKISLDQQSSGLVLGNGQGSLGPVKVEIKSRTEYDGMIFFDLKLIPQQTVKIDDITLRVRMPATIAQDYFIMGIATDMFSNVGPVADQNGIFWQSLKMQGAGNIIGKFIPYIYLGDGERGLTYATNSDRGRILDINKNADYLERKGDEVDLVIKIANTSREISKPRTFTFGLEAVPVKPLPDGYRKSGYKYRERHHKWPKNRFMNGYGGTSLSCWGLGPGTDCLTVRDKLEYKILRDQVLAAKRTTAPEFNAKVIKYIPTNTMGLRMKEFETFSGEWSGKTYIKPHPHPGYNKLETPWGFLSPKGGTRQYADMTQSNVDMRVWAFDQLQKQARLNGFWWDHSQFWSSGNLNKGTAYLKDDGTKQGILNIFLFRQLMKRLAVVSYENAIPFHMGQYAPGIMTTMGFGTYNWAVEGPWYCKPNKDLFVNFNNSLRLFRTLCGRWTGLPTTISSLVQEQKGEYPFQTRSAIALALLHDTPLNRAQHTPLMEVGKVLEKVDFFDNRTEWVPYWRSDELVKTDNPQIVATVYLNSHDYDGKKAMVVIFNADDKDESIAISLDGNKLVGKENITVLDAETDKKLSSADLKKLAVKKHDYRLLLVK